MKLRVWKWYHGWGDDHSISLWPTEVTALVAIHEYVRDAWNEGDYMDDVEFTGDWEVDTQKYFECHNETEWYSLDPEVVEFPDNVALADNEIELSSDECAVVVHILGEASYAFVAEKMGLRMEEVAEHLDSAYRKLKD